MVTMMHIILSSLGVITIATSCIDLNKKTIKKDPKGHIMRDPYRR